MALTLALMEGGLLFTAVLAAIVVWGHPGVAERGGALTVLAQALAVCGCCITAFYYNDFYDLNVVKSFSVFAARLLSSFGTAFVLLAALYAVFPWMRLADGPFMSSFVLVTVLLLPLRALSYVFIRSHPFRQRLLLLGSGELAAGLVREIARQPHRRYTIVGIVDDNAAGPDLGPPRLGPLDRLGDIIASVRPDRVVVALSERRGRLPVRQLVDARLDGIRIEDGVEMYERLTGKLAIESLTPSGIIFSRDFRKSRLDLAAGRTLSLVAAVAGLIVTAPVLGLIALAIKLESGRPVLYVHERVGLHGRRFRLLKFRTMHRGGAGATDWTRDQSDRVTAVGKWLRRFRLDELPQFVNILRGDMNLVGPRPHRVPKYEAFMAAIPYFVLRSTVRPGLTGWAQVRSGYAAALDEETEKVRYDLYYLKHLSLGLDLRILFDTVNIVLFGRGSRAPKRRTAEPRAVMTPATPAARSAAR